MITSSVDTRAVSEVVPTDDMRVSPPTSPLLAMSDAFNVAQLDGRVEVSLVDEPPFEESLSAEKIQEKLIEELLADFRKYPDSARVMTKLGMAFLNAGKLVEAAERLEASLDINPDNIPALSALARVRLKTHKTNESEQLYRRVLEIDNQNVNALINLASIALRSKDYLGAVQWMERVIEENPVQSAAQYVIAMIYLQLGRSREAIAKLRSAIRETPKSAELRQGLAVSYVIIGDQKRAEEQFKTALLLRRSYPEALYGLATLLAGQNRSEESADLLLNYLSSTPDDLKARELLAHAYVLGAQFGKARTQLFTLLDSPTAKLRLSTLEISKVHNNIGFCYAREGRLSEAEKQFASAIELDKASPVETYENLLRAYLSDISTNAKKAISLIETAASRGITSTDFSLLQASALVRVGKHSGAIDVLQKLVLEGNAPVAAYADLGWLLGDWDENYSAAIAVLNEGLDKFGSSPQIVNNLAYSHLELGQVTAANLLINLLPPDDEKLPHMLATKGLLLLWQGQIKEGDRFYKLAADRAGQQGNRPLMLAIRQKRSLEVARALVREGQLDDVTNLIQEGLETPHHGLPFKFDKELSNLLHEIRKVLPSNSEKTPELKDGE